MVYLVTVVAMAVECYHLPVVGVPVLKAISVEVLSVASAQGLAPGDGRGHGCRCQGGDPAHLPVVAMPVLKASHLVTVPAMAVVVEVAILCTCR